MTIDPKHLTTTAKLTFSEDFGRFSTWNGVTGLDVTANIRAPLPSSSPGTNGFIGSGEKQWYVNPNYRPPAGSPALPNPFSTTGGVLTISARPAEAAIRPIIGGQTYTSGVVSTYHEFSQTYGYFEMRAQLPAGKGLWPAFWLMPKDGSWPPEIDVMEQLGKDPRTIYTSFHSQFGGEHQLSPGHFYTTNGWSVADTSKGFHTFGVDWEPQTITWYYDGRKVFTAPTPADANKPIYMIANLAVGGTWPGNPDGTTIFPAQMKIDYLRAYTALPTPVTPPPAPHADSLTFKVSEDVFGEDARFVVKVDGVQRGGVHTTHANHAAGVWDTVTLLGDFSTSSHVSVTYLNDANDGRGHDRNLYVSGLALDGHALDMAHATLSAGAGFTRADVTMLWSNGSATYGL